MSRLPTSATVADAPEAARPLPEAVKTRLGAVPNLFRVVANSPAGLEGHLGLNGALRRRTRPPPPGPIPMKDRSSPVFVERAQPDVADGGLVAINADGTCIQSPVGGLAGPMSEPESPMPPRPGSPGRHADPPGSARAACGSVPPVSLGRGARRPASLAGRPRAGRQRPAARRAQDACDALWRRDPLAPLDRTAARHRGLAGPRKPCPVGAAARRGLEAAVLGRGRLGGGRYPEPLPFCRHRLPARPDRGRHSGPPVMPSPSGSSIGPAPCPWSRTSPTRGSWRPSSPRPSASQAWPCAACWTCRPTAPSAWPAAMPSGRRVSCIDHPRDRGCAFGRRDAVPRRLARSRGRGHSRDALGRCGARGAPFRWGFFEIPDADRARIAAAMMIDPRHDLSRDWQESAASC